MMNTTEKDGHALRVSIVIPAFNEEDAIGPCLDAVFEQSVPVDEVIVVDNNSTDATRARLAAYGDRVTVLHEPKQGVMYARDTGMDAAGGDVIGRIDADTRLPSGWVARLHELFANPTLQAVTGPARYYDILCPGLVARLDLVLRSAWARSSRNELDWVYGANMALRASAWWAVRRALCDDASAHEDVDLGIHLYDTGHRVAFVPSLWASTSARRVSASQRDFRTYMLLTERCYAAHAGQVSDHAYLRAWITARLILLAYPSARLMHRAYRPGGRPSLRRLRSAVPARKNPMADG